jgi:hypothetical protein
MLPKQTVPEGSRKVLNEVEVYTRRNFTTDRGNFFQTMGGDFILPNGKPVEDVSILESLSEPQRSEALAWWDQRLGGVKDKVRTLADDIAEEIPHAGKKITKAELRAKARFLMEQADEMEDEEVPEESPEVPEPAEVASGQQKDDKELKRSAGKTKSVLSQMGIST